MTAYDTLIGYARETRALELISGRLGWDAETMMAKGSSQMRAEEMAAMQGVLHARRTSTQMSDMLGAVDVASLDRVGQAQLRHIRKSYERAAKVPGDLSAELARKTSLAHRIWADARASDDFAAFAPILKEVVALKRQEAQALAAGGDLYDAMIDDYEPGMKATELSAMFDALRPRLVALREAALAAEQPKPLDFEFPEEGQLKLSRIAAEAFGYDFNRGRMDKAVHPFCSGAGNDVRITTRTSATDPFNCLYSTIHEVGHACYEQSIDQAYLLTPLGEGVSMGVHESQSRIFENQLGRSEAFTGWLFGQMRDVFGDFGVAGEDTFYKLVNQVKRGFIRTEADEIQYNLHVLLRFDLERQIISGDLEVDDLEAAWNARFEADFGYKIDKPSHGVLQDVHWSEGLYGYFPTYSLGNVYAGCLYQALRGAVPGLDDQLAAGDASVATGWLRDNLQVHGGLYEPAVVVEKACGFAPSEAPLLSYIEGKFKGVYGL